MTYSQAIERAHWLADYRQSNYAVCAALPGELAKGFYAEDAETAPPDQVVIYVAPRKEQL